MKTLGHLLEHGLVAGIVVPALNQFGAGIEFSMANWVAATTLFIVAHWLIQPVNYNVVHIHAAEKETIGETE